MTADGTEPPTAIRRRLPRGPLPPAQAAVLFMLVGPAVGGLVVMLGFYVANLGTAQAASRAAGVFAGWPLFVAFGYFFGLGPALLTGVLVGFVHQSGDRRAVIYPLAFALGAVASACMGGLMRQPDWMLGAMAGAGAAAALVCTSLARRFGRGRPSAG